MLGLAAVSLTIVNYGTPWFFQLFPNHSRTLWFFSWWTGLQLVFWVAVPVIVARRFGFTARTLGFGKGIVWSKLWIYGVLYVVAFVPILLASWQQGFIDKYPFVRPDQVEVWSWRLLIGFWTIYAAQFFCVEFFFRGFLVFTLRPRFGYASIAIMMVPYCMLHFSKPMPEAVSAIVGGAILGWLALETESIWGGVILHIAVALTMDTMALFQNEVGFPAIW